jgi:hypothetical protein
MKWHFELGRIVITSRAFNAISQEDIDTAISRHERCDWGEIDRVKAARNNANALTDAGQIESLYKDSNGTLFSVMTHSDRSGTTIMLPEEYRRDWRKPEYLWERPGVRFEFSRDPSQVGTGQAYQGDGSMSGPIFAMGGFFALLGIFFAVLEKLDKPKTADKAVKSNLD